MKNLYILPLLGVLLASGCSTAKPLSRQERAAIKVLYIATNRVDYIRYIGPTGALVKVYDKSVFDHALKQTKAYLGEKGYQLTDDSNLADYRLVIKPHTARPWPYNYRIGGAGFFVREGTAYAAASFSLELVNKKTEALMAVSSEGVYQPVIGTEYSPNSWGVLTLEEKDMLMSTLKRTAATALRMNVNKIGL